MHKYQVLIAHSPLHCCTYIVDYINILYFAVSILTFSGSSIDPEAVARMKELWMLKHRHQHEGPRKVGDGKLTTVIKDLLVQKLESKARSLMINRHGQKKQWRLVGQGV